MFWFVPWNNQNLESSASTEYVDLSVREQECVIMEYRPFTTKMELLKRSRWCALDDMLRFLRTNQFIGFYVKANRECVRTGWYRLMVQAPFSRTTRFDANGWFVNVSADGISLHVNQFMHALDMHDRAAERHGVKLDEGNLHDAKRSYDTAMDALLRVCESIDEKTLVEAGIYNRELFETKYGLEWVAAEQ